MAAQRGRADEGWDTAPDGLKQTIYIGLIIALRNRGALAHGSQRHDTPSAIAHETLRETGGLVQINCIGCIESLCTFLGRRRHDRQCAAQIVSLDHMTSFK